MTFFRRIGSILAAILLTPLLLILWPILVIAVAIIKPTTAAIRSVAPLSESSG